MSLVSCNGCPHATACGGVQKAGEFDFGCFTGCGGECKRFGECYYVCPSREEEFACAVHEVGGLDYVPESRLRGPDVAGMPVYVPHIRHGYKRASCARTQDNVFAIALADILARRWPAVGSLAEALRREFKIDRKSIVLVTGVASDDLLERWWDERVLGLSIGGLLARMDVWGVTGLNYSILRDAPRTHTLYNRSRSFIALERLSESGLGVIPHVYAETPSDWKVWLRVLREQPSIWAIAAEFQTGCRRRERGAEYIRCLRRLIEECGRSIHVVAIGARQFARDLGGQIGEVTITDSFPFLATVNRRGPSVMAPLDHRWVQFETRSGELLDGHFARAMDVYAAQVRALMGRRSATKEAA